MNESGSSPCFAVVGHPNKGKSSIVATLSQDDSVMISPLSGTTTHSTTYPMVVDGRELYRLVDTPGFQRARQAMEWMQARSRSVADRAGIVADFLRCHRDDPRFEAECQLLEPIMDGAGILYVVDGSRPYAAEYEAEMEILRWTGRPSMALINPIGDSAHIENWRNALSQYFRIVRVFNAQTADHDKKLQLLSGFSELNEAWHQPLNEAVEILDRQRTRRRHRSAELIASMIADLMTRSLESPMSGEDEAGQEMEMSRRFHEDLERGEKTCRSEVEQVYGYRNLERSESAFDLLPDDLFSEKTWKVLGLSNDQLLATGTLGGAAAGGVIDMASGGSSLLIGSGIGALVGGLSAWFGREQLAKTRIRGNAMGQKVLVIGPVKSVNFPYILLDRALLHQRLIEERTHARRERLEISAQDSRSRQLDAQNRKSLEKVFRRIRDAGTTKHSLLDELTRQIVGLIEA